MSSLGIKINGLDKAIAAFKQFPQQVGRYTAAAGTEAGNEVLDTPGVRLYPASTAANEPPTPFYIRGEGTQHATYNEHESQRLGTQYYVEASDTSYKTTIGNRATYSPYVAGEEQAAAMGAIGWRKLYEVAVEKLETLRGIYQGWIDKLIKDLGL